jgi:hypothetical protein
MRKSVLALGALFGLSVATSALAQPEDHDVGIFADAAGTMTSMTVAGLTTGNFFYVVGHSLDGGVSGWELGVDVDPNWTMLAGIYDQPVSINHGSIHNYIVDSQGCYIGEPTYTLVTYEFGYFGGAQAPNDALFCVIPSSPSSFDPPAPGYQQCDGSLVRFGVAQNGFPHYPNGCLVVNPLSEPPVVAAGVSWSAVKASF